MKSWKPVREKVPSSSSRNPARSIVLSAATLRRWRGTEGIVSVPAEPVLTRWPTSPERATARLRAASSLLAGGRGTPLPVPRATGPPRARRHARGSPGGTRARSVISPWRVRLAFISCGTVTDESARPAGSASCPAQPPAERPGSQELRAPGTEW